MANNTFLEWHGELAGKLMLQSIKGHEAACEPFHYEMYSETTLGQEELDDLFLKPACCKIGPSRDIHIIRYVHGVITQIVQHRSSVDRAGCTLTIEPTISLMRLSKAIRVWQNITVPQLVRSLLSEHNACPLNLRLQRTYAEREYCIQYRESDLDFIIRMLEEEGITWFFLHEEDKHTLVLTDHPAGHPNAGVPELRWYDREKAFSAEHIWQWSSNSTAIPDSVILHGYNIQQASGVMGKMDVRQSHYSAPDVGYSDITALSQRPDITDTLSAFRDAFQANAACYHAITDAHSLTCAEVFHLTNHPVDNGAYRVQKIAVEARNAVAGGEYQAELCLLRNDVVWRPKRMHPPPVMADVLTAKVVGPDSEQIHTDELGRVRICFPWENPHAEECTGSCWVRVAQPWAGQQFGTQFLPAVGTEVLVMFSLGIPVVMGSVFNGQNLPPFPLPAGKAETGILSRRAATDESPDDGHRLSFNDTKGQEKLTIVAARDLSLTVKNEVSNQIGGNRDTHMTQGNDRLTLKNGHLLLTLEKGDIRQKLTGDYDLAINNGCGNIHADQKFSMEAGEALTLSVGKSSITLSSTGINIDSPSITISSGSKLELSGQLIKIG